MRRLVEILFLFMTHAAISTGFPGERDSIRVFRRDFRGVPFVPVFLPELLAVLDAQPKRRAVRASSMARVITTVIALVSGTFFIDVFFMRLLRLTCNRHAGNASKNDGLCQADEVHVARALAGSIQAEDGCEIPVHHLCLGVDGHTAEGVVLLDTPFDGVEGRGRDLGVEVSLLKVFILAFVHELVIAGH